VGVAAAGKYRSLGEPPASFIYLPYQQGAWDLNLGVVLRTEGDALGFAGALRQAIHALDPGVEVWALLTMPDFIQAAFLAQRIVSTLLVALGAVALILAAMGIYGVMSYLVSQRTHELGIRMALGASAGRVTQLVLSQGMRLAGIGLAVGMVGAVALSHLLTNFLYGVSPFDPFTFLGVAVMLSCVSLAACFLPAWRASRVDPMVVLRSE
jgi:ABC-type antimicrobial peptide transport system permease subunit